MTRENLIVVWLVLLTALAVRAAWPVSDYHRCRCWTVSEYDGQRLREFVATSAPSYRAGSWWYRDSLGELQSVSGRIEIEPEH